MLQPLRLISTDPSLRLASALIVLFGCLAASIAPYQSLIAIDVFGLPDAAYSLVLIAAAAVSVVGGIWIGILTDRSASRKRVAFWSAGLIVAGNALVLAAPGPVTFIAAHAVILPLSGSLMGQIFALARLAAAPYGAERDAILAAIRALFALPFIVVLPIWSVAFDAGTGLLAIYGAILGVGAVMMVLVQRAWPADGHARWADPKSGLSLAASVREIASGPLLLRVWLTGAINGGVFLYMILLGLVFRESAGRDIGDVAIFAGLVAGLEVPVMLSMAAILRRMSRITAILAGAAIYAGFLLAFPVLLPSPSVWLLVIPAAVGGGVILSLPIAYVQDLLGDRAGTGSALLAVSKVAGDGTAAAVFAAGTLLGGYGLASVLGGITTLSAALALWWLDSRAAVRRRTPVRP